MEDGVGVLELEGDGIARGARPEVRLPRPSVAVARG
jgi:hypothetical protein